jgi:hypothetical protein
MTKGILIHVFARFLGLLVGPVCAVTFSANPVEAAPRAVWDDDARIVREAERVATGERVEVFQHGLEVAPEFLGLAEEAYSRLEELTGRKLDAGTLGQKIRIYVSSAVRISHVWRGYEHPRDPKGIVFLNRRVYRSALEGTDSTYVHEMAHLFTWRYRSHTLREGLADYLALEIHPGSGVGPNVGGYDWDTPIPREIVKYLGTTRMPPRRLTSDPRNRRAYYFASYQFVKFLIEKGGMDDFLELYDSENPEAEFRRLYGASREELVKLAGI